MAQQRKTHFVALHVLPPARLILRKASYDISSQRGEDIAMSPILIAAMAVAQQHPQEFEVELDRALADLEAARQQAEAARQQATELQPTPKTDH